MMDLPFLKLLSYFLLLNSFINLASSEVDRPVYFNHSCTITKNFTSDSPFQYNLETLISSLYSKASTTTLKFYKASVNDDPTIYGEFMCREDVPIDVCQNCVQDATSRIRSECPDNTEAIIWYNYCFVRYSDRYFFSYLQQIPIVRSFTSDRRNMRSHVSLIVTSKLGITNMTELRKALSDVAAEAAASTKRFATKEMNLTSSGSVYGLVQCTPDLSQQLCSECLTRMIKLVPEQDYEFGSGRIVNPSCNLMIDGDGQFYYQGNQAPYFLAQEPGHPSFQDYNCSFTNANHAYLNNLKTLALELSNSSNNPKNNGFNTTVIGKNSSDTVYGLFMCRGDVSLKLCHECVNEGFGMLNSSCSSSKEAVIWYDMCMVRYSNRSFFSNIDMQPRYGLADFFLENQKAVFKSLLVDTLNDLVEETPKSVLKVKNFGTKNASIPSMLKLYSLAQCTPNLSRKDCQKCLEDARQQIKECCFGSKGGQAMNPSCNLRFETYAFYNDSLSAVSKPPTNPQSPKVSVITGKDDEKFRTILITVSVIVVSIILSGFGLYYWKRKQSKSFKAILKKIFGSEGATLESLQFHLATIEAATDKFSAENRIGRGGFGEVYMGTLADGRKIAVKRLSRNSSQGLSELKAEILLIAKLQHRNLVALLGFCLTDQEKILVYEYVPNKSLDYFLFGSQESRVLNWSERYNIIGGVARGILYLHEHSRLKVIHRDLKPSNILLDDELNPKISDFGLARIVGIDETIQNTARVVGTWGYMSPEYITFGEFSEKSDVFSFGVIVLEIISGKNINYRRESQYSGGLLSDVWKHWRDANLIAILDSNLTVAEPHGEIIRCTHIGLLCVQGHPQVRPSMNEIVKYLSNDSMQLPIPKEPAFFIHSQMEQATTSGAMEAHIPNHNQYSINEMSESTLFPR